MVDTTQPPETERTDQLGHALPYSADSLAKLPQNKPKKRWPYIVLALVVLAVAGFAVWKFVLTSNEPQQPAVSTNEQTPSNEQQPSDANDVPMATNFKEFSSGFLGLKFTYPDTWQVTETPDNGVRVESPEFTYSSTSQAEVNGNFRIYIRKGARESDGKYIGRGVAIEPSQKLTYANPAAGQRTETNLSLFGLDTADNFAFFMIAGNYSLQKGDTLGPDYGKEAETYIIAGGFSSPELTDDLATNPVSPNLVQTSNAYKQALDVLKSLNLR